LITTRALIWLLLSQNQYRDIPGIAILFRDKYRGQNSEYCYPYHTLKIKSKLHCYGLATQWCFVIFGGHPAAIFLGQQLAMPSNSQVVS